MGISELIQKKGTGPFQSVLPSLLSEAPENGVDALRQRLWARIVLLEWPMQQKTPPKLCYQHGLQD